MTPASHRLTGLVERYSRFPGPDLVWSESERSPARGDGSDKSLNPLARGLPDSLANFLLVFVGSASPPAST